MKLPKPIPQEDLELIKQHVDYDRLRTMKGLVTGATGWFGNWVCSALNSAGCFYETLDTRHMHYVDCDYCIHLAHGEVKPLIDMLQRTSVQRVLFTSSGGVYMENPDPPAKLKIRHENEFLFSGLPVNIARCFSFIGPGICEMEVDYAAKNIISQVLKSGKPIMAPSPRSIRAYMYMADLVIWLLNILLAPIRNIYDVGGEEPINMIDFAVRAENRLSWWYATYKDPRPYYVPNLTRAKEELGLEVYIDLDTAIEKTIKYYEQIS